ncbi:alkene reductase [Martelella sp. FOR1707]
MDERDLFGPVTIGGIELKNRIAMAPMTRSRADFEGNVSPLAAEYYAQRASAGLVITEAIAISPQAHGYPFTPGIWSAEQRAAWRAVTDAVHAAGGHICAQLWHVGRVFSKRNNPLGLEALGPSAVAPAFKIFTKSGVEDIATPRPMTAVDIAQTIEDFATAAFAALEAGFDLVELHCANGYIIEQFLSDEANQRTDAYGGSRQARLKFFSDILDAIRARAGDLSRIGIRLSPFGDFNGIRHSDPMGVFRDVLGLIENQGLAYLHIIEPSISGDGSRRVAGEAEAPDVLAIARAAFSGPIIACADYDHARAQDAIRTNRADMIAFGRPYISNPDLVERLKAGVALAEYDRSTFYTRGAKGYVDYPRMLSAKADANT